MPEKILIIDDDRTILNITAELLVMSGYHTISAEDGITGISLAGSAGPDVIICDIVMPGLSGYEVFSALSRNSSTAVIPFIFLTSKDNHDELRKGMMMGASDYLTKPVNSFDLLMSVEARLKKQRASKKEASSHRPAVLPSADPWKAIREIKDGITRCLFTRNEVLFSEGDVQKYIFLLERGRIKTLKSNDNGKRVITGLYGNGDLAGCIAKPGRFPVYCDTAIAQEDAEALKIPADIFFSLVEHSREISMAYLRFMSKDIDRKELLMMNIALHSARKRMAEVLLMGLEYYNESRNADNHILIPMSREDLANLSGLSTESAIRILSSFRKDGLVRMDDKGHIIIHDIEKLRGQKN